MVVTTAFLLSGWSNSTRRRRGWMWFFLCYFFFAILCRRSWWKSETEQIATMCHSPYQSFNYVELCAIPAEKETLRQKGGYSRANEERYYIHCTLGGMVVNIRIFIDHDEGRLSLSFTFTLKKSADFLKSCDDVYYKILEISKTNLNNLKFLQSTFRELVGIRLTESFLFTCLELRSLWLRYLRKTSSRLV